MQAIETCLQSYLNLQEKPLRSTEAPVLKDASNLDPFWAIKKIVKTHTLSLIHSSIKNKFYPMVSQKLPKEKETASNDVQSQAKQCLSLIEDPLWKHICSQIIGIIGPVWVLKIYNSQLGPLSPQDKNVNLYCQTAYSAPKWPVIPIQSCH